MAFYHHGSSISEQKVPVSYLLQWEAIKEAKQRGCRSYNFWGIAPDVKEKLDIAKSRHPWAGLTLFKMGFGGRIKEYVKTQDFPISFSYWLTFIFERLRKIKRGL
jgi:lipid II:glycine glycyltransferase (peptidoglycan interpeptide bridge formation enzyme)